MLSCPLIILTLGLFVFVINAITLWLALGIAVSFFHVGFYIDDFWAAFLGALIVSIISVVLNALVKEDGIVESAGTDRTACQEASGGFRQVGFTST